MLALETVLQVIFIPLSHACTQGCALSYKCGSPVSTLAKARLFIKPFATYRRVLENIITQLFLLSLQGSMFNTWKPMWVVLLEDGVEFYKKKSDNSPKGMIPLKGSTLTSPCQDFGKRMVS